MILTFNFVFPVANKLYNLWNSIIIPNIPTKNVLCPASPITIPDFNFSQSPVIPKNVKSLKYQSQNAIVNPNNGGAVIKVFGNNYTNQLGEELLSGSWDSISTDENNINLQDINFSSTAVGAGINVEITV